MDKVIKEDRKIREWRKKNGYIAVRTKDPEVREYYIREFIKICLFGPASNFQSCLAISDWKYV